MCRCFVARAGNGGSDGVLNRLRVLIALRISAVGVKDGTLRMLRNGSYEILDCSAFPACDIHGGPRVNQM